MGTVFETPPPVGGRRPPEPPGWPLIGHLHSFWRNPLGFLSETARLGDVVRLRLGPYRAYLLTTPALVQQVFQTLHRQTEKKSPVQRGAKQILGEGLATSEGEFHLKQRRLLQPAFHRARIEGYGREFVKQTACHVASWKDGDELDMAQEMTRLTLAIVAKTLFDADVGDEAAEIGRVVEDATALFKSVLLPFPELRKRLPLPSTRRMARARARLDKTIYRFIAEHRADGRDRGDLLSMLLDIRDDETGEAMPDRQIRDEALTLFAAGHETSANGLTWAFYLLSQHPEVIAAATRQIDAVLGGRLPEPADLPNLPILRQIFAESLRLYPPGWLITVVALEDITVGDYRVPANAMVMMAPWLMHRDPRFFEDPLEFRPERWTPQMQEALPKYAYFPFGGGPRVCIGEHFAWMEAVMVLAVVLSQWRLDLAPQARVEIQPVLTLRARYGMPMVLRRRSSSPMVM